jgi:CDGSH-type Zn-finger protein
MSDREKNARPQIIPIPNGPYLYFDEFVSLPVKYIRSSSGKPYAKVRSVSLCRCGASADKPFCDGSHTKIKFSDKKESDGRHDKREDYTSGDLTVHDNRALCSHAGECTRGLPSVFNSEARPWIDPSKASPEDIVETVKRCPSGALSHSLGGVEHRDQDREPMIKAIKDGPFDVVGGIELLGVSWGEGASTEHYSLCRCGASKNKPFCDGSHSEAGFKDGE